MSDQPVVLMTNSSFGDDQSLINENPYLIGNWSGVGGFLDTDIRNQMGDVFITLDITREGSLSVKVDQYDVQLPTIRAAKYGFEIRGDIETFKKNGIDLKKDKFILLFVLPDNNQNNISVSDANFHLKSNFFFDFTMRVGGVILEKK